MPDRVVRPALSRIAPEQTETREISGGIAPAPAAAVRPFVLLQVEEDLQGWPSAPTQINRAHPLRPACIAARSL